MPSPERVRDSWKEDALFGYQFLNGANPMLLRRSTCLPARLLFPPGMEALKAQLEKELKVPECRAWWVGEDCRAPLAAGHQGKQSREGQLHDLHEDNGGWRAGAGCGMISRLKMKHTAGPGWQQGLGKTEEQEC